LETGERSQREHIRDVLDLDAGASAHKRMPRVVLAVLSVVIAVAVYVLWPSNSGSGMRYEFAQVERGDLRVTVTATGALQPVNQVDVGSELSGIIDSVAVDFNDRVRRGQVLARLDTDRLEARVIEAEASMASANAKLEEAKATVLETRLRYERCEQLSERKLCSQEELDTHRAAYARARAVEASARAQVSVAEATLDGNRTELAKAEIRSPIDGLVLQRQIEPGQTVAASLQAPVLFTLAEDLAQMELIVAVDEADVGKITEGQHAIFTVDAYPDRKYPAQITQVRFAPQTIEGVVTYETVLAVDNSDLSLRPGMTATAIITVQQLQDVMLVSNAALRFTPPLNKKTNSGGKGIFGALFRRPPHSRRRNETDTNGASQLWLLRDGAPFAVKVETGASDGSMTVLRSDDIEPGQRVMIDVVSLKQ
jgi:HlyD family secretion protein